MQMLALQNSIKFLTIWALVFTSAFSLPSPQVTTMKITGGDENHVADVILDGGVKKMAVQATATIEALFGRDPQASSYAFFGASLTDANGIGSAGDTVTTTIPAAVAPLSSIYPAVSVVTTIQASDVADDRPERAVAIRVCDDLNNDSDFQDSQWKCEVMKDFGAVFISSKLFNEWGERTSWTFTCSGTTSCAIAESGLLRRGYETELSRSPNNPRLGVLAISGTVSTIPGGTSDILIQEFMNGGSSNFIVNGSVTPVDFEIGCDPEKDRFINEIRQYIICSGLKLDQFFCKNGSLSNGVLVTVRSEGQELDFLPLQVTTDWITKFAIGPAGPTGQSRIDLQAGADAYTGSFIFEQPAVIKKCGTNGTVTDDFIRIRIRDNLTNQNLSTYSGLVEGFEREP